MKKNHKLFKFYIIRKFCGYVSAHNDSHALREVGRMYPDFKGAITVAEVENEG